MQPRCDTLRLFLIHNIGCQRRSEMRSVCCLHDCRSCPILSFLPAQVEMNVLLPLPVVPITRKKSEFGLQHQLNR